MPYGWETTVVASECMIHNPEGSLMEAEAMVGNGEGCEPAGGSLFTCYSSFAFLSGFGRDSKTETSVDASSLCFSWCIWLLISESSAIASVG